MLQNESGVGSAFERRPKKDEVTADMLLFESGLLDGPLDKRASNSSNLSVQSNDSLTKSRSSTESSCSSLVDISVSSTHNNSQEFETKKIKVCTCTFFLH